MEQPVFDKAKLINYWSESSDDDYETMIVMFESKRFQWALFVGHLKNNNDYPPFIHNLLRLAEKCNLVLADEQKLFFATVTAFNINARYDDYKMSFQKKCTPEYTALWVENIKNNRQWIKALIK